MTDNSVFNPFGGNKKTVSHSGLTSPFIPTWSQSSQAYNNKIPAAMMEGTAESSPSKSAVLIKGGSCIIPGLGTFFLDVRMDKGKIQALGKGLNATGNQVINAENKYIIPGVIDPHVHLGIFEEFSNDVVSETRSGLVNGVTTMGVYLGGDQSFLPLLDDIINEIEQKSFADIFIHLSIFTQEQLEEIPLYHSRYGIKSFKAYMCGIPGLIPSLEDGFLLELMDSVARLGEGAILNIHAENHRIVEWETNRIRSSKGDAITIQDWTDTHTGRAEAEAVQRAILLSEQSGVKIYFVHISSGEAIDLFRKIKKGDNGGSYFVETTSPYLTLDDSSAQQGLIKMVPPIRSKQNQALLWEGLREGIINTIGTDHTPLTKFLKKPNGSLWNTIPGYPAVGTHLPSLIDYVGRNNYSLVELVEKISSSPAKIFGIYPQKGSLLPGSDADVVIIDPSYEQVITTETAWSHSDFALHEGRKMIGWPVAVFKGGVLIDREKIQKCQQYAAGSYLKR